ncbi:MAG: hypothetical protein KGJ02_03575, partial [Verrucomicrobiota bacterium]|nr:hypothetical protein [Verrucomicrobiota bacterium]
MTSPASSRTSYSPHIMTYPSGMEIEQLEESTPITEVSPSPLHRNPLPVTPSIPSLNNPLSRIARGRIFGEYHKGPDIGEKLGHWGDEYLTFSAKFSELNEKLILLLKNRPANIAEWPAYEKRIQEVLWERFYAAQGMNDPAAQLAKRTDREHLRGYYYHDKITKQGKEILQQFHPIVIEMPDLYEKMKNRHYELVADSQEKLTFAKQWSEFKTTEEEFLKLSKIVYDSTIAQELRDASKIQLEEHKKTLDEQIKKLVEYSQSANVVISPDIKTIQDSLNLKHKRAQFYAKSDLENLRELETLFREGSTEYFFKSLTYQHKLIDEGRFSDAEQYALEWIKTVPQDAHWQDIQQMSDLFLQAIQQGNRNSLSSFQEALSVLLQNRPDLHLDSSNITPLNTESEVNGAQAIALLQGQLFCMDQDTSFAAGACYRDCEALMPSESTWKHMRALFHISTLQWAKARAYLNDLPTEQANFIRREIVYGRRNLLSLGIGLFSWGTNCVLQHAKETRFVQMQKSGHSFVEGLNIFLGLACNPVATETALAFFVDYSEGIPLSLNVSSYVLGTLTVAQLGAHFIFSKQLKRANNEEDRNKKTKIARAMNGGFQLLDAGWRVSGLVSAANIGTSLLGVGGIISAASSLISTYDEIRGNERSSDFLAMLKTARRVGNLIIPFDLVFRNPTTSLNVIRWTASSIGAEQLAAHIPKFFLTIPAYVGPVVTLSVIAVYGVFDFSKTRAACLMEKAQQLCL